ncbi:putative xylosidase/glycosyl hydrolase [Lojkania enalia]|uniref:Xylosidase/glycosyl hydrolase n=1 Tax=Lojkania enalia TaxID=147567 RepID=A0A9P4JUU4_9PLEO|nr:putative xylosidase/glycosyl hydrolase [Didymosphaeria enalia]
MKNGDRTGAVLFRDVAAYIGIHKDGASTKIVMVNNLNLDSSWRTKSTGTIAATGPDLGTATTEVWLKVQADITPAFSGTSEQRTTSFWYSTDGNKYVQLGPAFPMTNTWRFFTGYRYGVFNFATKEFGGQVIVESFSMQLT